jgi:hypothetical protein
MTSLRCRRKRLDVLLHESPSPLARQVALDRISPRPLQSNLRMLIPLAHQPSAPSIVSDKTIHQEKQSLRPSQLSSTPVPTSTSSASASPSDAPRPPSLLLRVFYALLLFPLLYAIHQLVVQPVGRTFGRFLVSSFHHPPPSLATGESTTESLHWLGKREVEKGTAEFGVFAGMSSSTYRASCTLVFSWSVDCETILAHASSPSFLSSSACVVVDGTALIPILVILSGIFAGLSQSRTFARSSFDLTSFRSSPLTLFLLMTTLQLSAT